MSGYLSNVSPVKTSKRKYFKAQKRKYFNFTLTDDTNIHRGICFSTKKHLFSSIEDKQSSNSGIELNKFKVTENDNIVVNDFKSAKQMDRNFEKKNITKKFSINSIINECALCDIVDISMLAFNLQEPTTVVKDVKPLRLRIGVIKDSTDKIPIIIFESLIAQISERSCCDMTNMPVQRYLDGRILKTNATSEVSSNNDIEVTTSDDDDDDDVYISPDETKIVAKVVALYLKTLVPTYLCLNCNVSVSIENGLVCGNNCNNVSAQSTCKSKAYL